jgi:hypothetical protein
MNAAHNISFRLQGANPLEIVRNWWSYITCFFVIASFLFAVKKSSLFLPREERILKRFLGLVERKYDISDGHMGRGGLFEIASATGNNFIADFASIYAGAVYRDRRLSDEEYIHLKQLLRSLEGGKSNIS